MKTLLYKDSTTDQIKIFAEVRNDYMEANNSDLPITDDVMQLIIFENLVQNGGNIILIEDEILEWCNDYAEYMEADRFLSQEERDQILKNIYESIIFHYKHPADFLLEEIKSQLTEEDGAELLTRLLALTSESQGGK